MLYRNFKEEQMKNILKVGRVEGIPPLTLPMSKGKNLKQYQTYGNSYQRLPQEYQEVEYIESTGTQYIDTGITGNNNTKIEVVFSINTMPSENIGVFGSRITAAATTDPHKGPRPASSTPAI